MGEIGHRFIETNGLRMHVAEAGPADGPLVLMLHGWPESWYSYRHQLTALGEAGYHAVAPDMRGYGQTGGPSDPAQYTMLHTVGDTVGLIAALAGSAGKAVVVGHDWGAPTAWNTALMRPDLVRGVVGLSVPYAPRGDHAILDVLNVSLGPTNYQAWFQPADAPEAVLGADTRETIRRVLTSAGGENPSPLEWVVPDGGTFLDVVPGLDALPSWLSEADLDVYAAEFARHGWTGPLNWYRSTPRTWELMAPWHNAVLPPVPALFVAGERDLVVNWPGMRDLIGFLAALVPGLTKSVLLDGCGHWTQQERPTEVNALLLEFLSGLPE